MPRLFYGNFDFEHALAGRTPGELPPAQKRLNAELAFAWLGMAETGDAIVSSTDVPAEFLGALDANHLPRVALVPDLTPASLNEWAGEIEGDHSGVELTPWGWTQELHEQASRLGMGDRGSAPNVVRDANSRQFSFRLEEEWGAELEGAAAVRSMRELRQRLSEVGGRWVIKANLGMAGRERLLGTGGKCDPAAENWVARHLQSDGVVFLEPWVQRLEEIGLQFEIPRVGGPRLLGLTPLLCDARGQYAGSRLQISADEIDRWRFALDLGQRAAERLQQMGYRGPAGIDAMCYRDAEGASRIRPLQDINARFTMGRLSLGFRRLLRDGEHGSWLHVRWTASGRGPVDPQDWCKHWQRELPRGTRILATSPFTLEGETVRHGTIVVAAGSAAALHVAEQRILGPADG